MVCKIFYFLIEIWCWQVFDQHFIWNLWQIIFPIKQFEETYSYKSLSHIFWPEITKLFLCFKERKMFCKACFKELAYYNTVRHDDHHLTNDGHHHHHQCKNYDGHHHHPSDGQIKIWWNPSPSSIALYVNISNNF